jgi:probable O-glycosylation ligase (exosortase A-associated)
MRSYFMVATYAGLLPLAFVQPFVGALIWCWISFMNPHREAWGFASTLPYAMICFVVTAMACVLAREPKRLELNAVTALLLVFAVCITLTTIAGIGIPDVMWRRWNATIKTIVGALLVASLLTSRERIHALIWLMAISIGFYGVKGGIFTVMTGGGFRVMGPPDTMISDRNHMAVALLMAVPLLNYLRMQAAHYWVRILMLGAAGATLLAAVGSQSRGALLALGATAAVLWWRTKNKIVSGVLIAGCLAGILAFMPDSWSNRMNTIATYEEDASAMGRIKIWRASWLLALERPLVGAGFRAPYSQFIIDRVAPDVNARAVHSIYFEVIGEHGFPTFIVWCGLTAAGLWYAWRMGRLARGRPDLAWAGDLGRMVQVSIVAYLVGGAFLSLSYWDFYWVLLIVTAAAHTLMMKQLRGEATERGEVRAAGAGWRRPAVLGGGAPQGAAARSAG